jgi:hypothetical protein
VDVFQQCFGCCGVGKWRGGDWYEPCVLQRHQVGRSKLNRRRVAPAADRCANCYNRTE